MKSLGFLLRNNTPQQKKKESLKIIAFFPARGSAAAGAADLTNEKRSRAESNPHAPGIRHFHFGHSIRAT